ARCRAVEGRSQDKPILELPSKDSASEIKTSPAPKTVERLGVNPKWLKNMKRWYKGYAKEWHERTNAETNEALKHYIAFGCIDPESCLKILYGQTPTVSSVREKYPRRRILEVELAATYGDGYFDAKCAMRAYTAHYLGALALSYGPYRFSGDSFSVALGIVL